MCSTVALPLHTLSSVSAETDAPTPERRGAARTDRRKHSRSGRRAKDPRFHWQRLAWLFAGYAIFLSIRSLPATLRERFFSRSTPTPS
jgi:hypothetical protein